VVLGLFGELKRRREVDHQASTAARPTAKGLDGSGYSERMMWLKASIRATPYQGLRGHKRRYFHRAGTPEYTDTSYSKREGREGYRLLHRYRLLNRTQELGVRISCSMGTEAGGSACIP